MISRTIDCKTACIELGIGPFGAFKNGDACYQAENGECMQDGKEGSGASIICAHYRQSKNHANIPLISRVYILIYVYICVCICIYISALASVVLGYNKLCSDEGLLNLDEEDCKMAALERGMTFGRETTSGYPNGCYKYSYAAYFNRHSAGSRHSSSAPICRHLGNA